MRHSLLLLALACLPATLRAQPLTSHPVVERITTEGLLIDDTQRVILPRPLVSPGMSAEAQREAFSQLVGARRLDKYLQDSVVAPFKLTIEEVGATQAGATARGLDLWFIVHGNLDLINREGLMSGMMGGGQQPERMAESGFETYAKSVDETQPEPSTARPPWACWSAASTSTASRSSIGWW